MGIAIGVGIVIATIVGATESVDWRVAIGAAVVPSALMLGLMLRLPTTPTSWSRRDARADTSGWRGLREGWVQLSAGRFTPADFAEAPQPRS